ncbi:uncharacterized protein EHS24_000913 [Apiotrichum porosum]|uniref:RNA-dependent RNA polymerase n=1 Tax=Apiotrichum porosum TaxID=105984 RepID=A0A427YBA5_9TREE|nr:uncharacterized protein EHS24_000913 [Apiotrichum porosum]RSH88373.1 hypothetical protein EHS24_000913 [Apiotrichum porosum]
MDPTDPALLDVDWENQFGTLQLESGPLDPIVASLMGLNIGSQRRKRDSRSPESLVGRIRLNSNAANGSHHDTEGSGYRPRRRRSSSPDSPPTRRSSSSSSSNQGEPVPPGPTIGQFGTTMDTRRELTSMFSAPCLYGLDPTRPGNGRSLLAFDFKRELLVIRTEFEVEQKLVKDLPPVFRPVNAELPFSDISRHGIHFVEEARQGGRTTLVVTVAFRRPPRFFTPFEKDVARFNEHAMARGRAVYRRRATAMDFAVSETKEKDAGTLRAIPDGSVANPIFCNAYRWTFHLNDAEVGRFKACANKLRMMDDENPDAALVSTEKREKAREVPRVMQDWYTPDLSEHDFETRALIEGLIGNGILRPGDVVALMKALKMHAPAPMFRHRLLESLFTEERIRDPARLIPFRANNMRLGNMRMLDHVVRIRTVQVTPTRILVGPPQEETSNSVTRRYHDKLDAIIRVQFVDEGDRLHILDYTKHADKMLPQVGLMARIRRTLQYGIMIAGERYYPVASSSSQQKDHSIWFINHRVIDRVALSKWMGTPKEKVVAKYSARMGLPFSGSRAVDIKISLGRIPDIERDKECFTDGCSMAGTQVMAQSAQALGITCGLDANPSAIQFRLGGAKGVLSCWPELVSEYQLLLRPSQEKFDSKLKDLNVIRVARYQVAFLNRQFIMIMSANGVPDSLFREIFTAAVINIKGMPGRVRKGILTAEDQKYMQMYTDFPLPTIIQNGYHTNPMVLDMCRLVECISDESGTLKENEIFCQYQETDTHDPKVITGEVLVCRAPALHPGDVRRAQAVDLPHLRHLKNVVVFNTAGKRAFPNMLGGGDLDGDDYTIIWDQRFVQPLKVYEAMDYSAPKPLTVERVTQSDLNENFVQYILNDVLGQVDNAHLGQSDLCTPFNKIPLLLSEVHSWEMLTRASVDFAKTGLAVTLDPSWIPEKWPDFMGKPDNKTFQPDNKTYDSQKILGQLFRLVDPAPVYVPADIRKLGFPFEPHMRDIALHPELLQLLLKYKMTYENMMTYTMRRFKVEEVELVTGIATQTKQRKRSRELNHLHEPLRDSFNNHVKTIREEVEAEVAAANFPFAATPEVIAAHAYALTYGQKEVEAWEKHLMMGAWGGMNHGDMETLRPRPMMSFAWVWQDALVQVAQLMGMGP